MAKEEEYMMEKDVSYIVYQGTVARFERIIRRLIILIGVILVLCFGYITYDHYVDSLYDYSNVDLNSEDGGNANYIGASGVINNGESKSKDKDAQKQEQK